MPPALNCINDEEFPLALNQNHASYPHKAPAQTQPHKHTITHSQALVNTPPKNICIRYLQGIKCVCVRQRERDGYTIKSFIL